MSSGAKMGKKPNLRKFAKLEGVVRHPNEVPEENSIPLKKERFKGRHGEGGGGGKVPC